MNKVKYYVTDYDIMPTIDYDNINNITLTEYNNMIKQHLLDYGAMLVGTYSPNENIGYCYHYNEKEDYHMINVDGNCGKNISNYRHQMTIVGWDDDFQYNYCQLTDSTISNLENCNNIVSGKGAWILQNSWGENKTPYLYMAYNSKSVIEGGFTSVLKKDWDNNYDVNKEILNKYDKKNNTREIKWVRTKEIKETINRLTFTTNVANAEYDIYFANGDNEYKYLTSVYKEYAGAYSIDFSDFDNDIKELKGNSFSFKVELKNKIESGIILIEDINVFTNYVNDIYEQTYEFITKINVFDAIYTNTNKIDIYTTTRNIPNGNQIQYKLFDSNDNEIIDNIKFSKSLVLNNLAKNTLNISNALDVGVYYLKSFYMNHEVDSYKMEVKNIVDFGDGGTGHINDPILISKAEDILKIGTNDNYLNLSYKLVNNIDLANINWEPIGTKEKPFTGNFDGDNYIISNLNVNDKEYGGLFGFTNGSEIKNLYLYDFIINSTHAGSLVANDSSSTIHDIYVNGGKLTGKLNSGGIIGKGEIGNYYNLVSNIDINASNNFAGGIIAEMSHSKLNTSISYSTIKLDNTFNVGGIAGSAIGCTLSDVSCISNISGSSRNFGGIVSYFQGSINNAFIINDYNLTSSNNNDLINKTIFSTDSINNVYYVNNFNTLPNLVLNNVHSYSKEELKNKDIYKGFDFENVWRETDEYPVLKFINDKFYEKLIFIEQSNYKVNYQNNIIYNVKTYVNNDRYKLLFEQFKNNFVSFDGKVNDKNGVQIGNGGYISTGMKYIYKGKEYTISLLGDVHEDSVVSISDAVRLKQYLAGMISLSEVQLLAADTYNDNKINLTDSIVIQKNLAGIDEDKIYLEEGEY